MLPCRALLGENVAINDGSSGTLNVELAVLLWSLALALVLGSELEQLALCGLETKALVVALVVNLANVLGVTDRSVWIIVRRDHLPSEPNVGRSAANRGRHLLDSGLTRHVLGNTSDDYRSRTVCVDVGGVGEPALTDFVKVLVLSVDQVQSPGDQNDGDDKVSDVANLVRCCHVAESELVETRVACVWGDGTGGQLRNAKRPTRLGSKRRK